MTEANADYRTPPMPTSEAEWACHWAFYKLTVMQRDAAWRECDQLREALSANDGSPPNANEAPSRSRGPHPDDLPGFVK